MTTVLTLHRAVVSHSTWHSASGIQVLATMIKDDALNLIAVETNKTGVHSGMAARSVYGILTGDRSSDEENNRKNIKSDTNPQKW